MEELGRDKALEILERGRIAHVGVVDDAGPYVSPISYALVRDRLVFVTLRGRRFRAIRADPRVSVEVAEADDTHWRSVVVNAVAEIVTGTPLHTDGLHALLTKYRDEGASLLGTSRSPGPDLTEVVAVPLDTVSGRASGGGTNPNIRPGRL